MRIFKASKEIRQILDDDYNQQFPPGEEELTRRFLSLLSGHNRIHAYMTSKSYEAKIGTDWLWLIFTDSGVTPFLVQAKKLPANKQEISRNQVTYKSSSGHLQIELLLQAAKVNGIPAIYALYSNKIQQVPCGTRPLFTFEGVFMDSAEKLYQHFVLDQGGGVKHMPISCLFACFSGKCQYDYSKHNCKACKKCKTVQAVPGRLKRTCQSPCPAPFQEFMRQEYDMAAPTFPLNEKLLPLLYGYSVLSKYPQHVVQCLGSQFSDPTLLPQRVIITDYVNRHSGHLTAAIMGKNFIVDTDTTYTKEDIIPVLRRMKKQFGIIKKLGLFGSYSRGVSTSESDIDIALVFYEEKFREYESVQMLGNFIREMIKAFHKNIDFVDYEAALKRPESADFIHNIDQDLIWI